MKNFMGVPPDQKTIINFQEKFTEQFNIAPRCGLEKMC